MMNIENLRVEIAKKEAELYQLRQTLKEQVVHEVKSGDDSTDGRDDRTNVDGCGICVENAHGLETYDLERFSRQLLLSEFGVRGQQAIRNASVLVVGCGGLGCPVAIYLAGAGVGRIGLVDHDVVELNNLHRQVQHAEASVGSRMLKAVSLAESCQRLNSKVVCDTHCVVLNSTNAMSIVSEYGVVVDATDNVATRYLINDACVLAGKPLVSGSALRFEGQLTIYNYKGSPCYRCLFPAPPPPDMVTNCSDSGVLGPVVGVIGAMQAVETLKVIANIGETYAGRMLLYDGLDGSVRTVRLRTKQKNCAVCGELPTVKHLIDYEGFCGSSATDKSKAVNCLSSHERISAREYADIVQANSPHILVDVRSPVELEICKLPMTTHNIPMSEFQKPDGCASGLKQLQNDIASYAKQNATKLSVYVVCRRGNDSQIAVRKLQSILIDMPIEIQDIAGGLYAWSDHVDKNFPKY